MDDGIIVRMADVRAATLCSGGARQFFRHHDLDWSDFLRNGISERRLLELNDALADRVVEVARGRRR